jgi:hypothetical protein
MPELNIEGKLILYFPEGWLAIKLDDEAWYRDDMKSTVKAVDVVATQGTNHWWIEVKDCAGYEPANLPRLSATEPHEVSQARQWLKQQGFDRDVQARRSKPFIVDEVFEKFMGSMLCIVAANRAQHATTNAATLKPFMAALGGKGSLNLALLLTWKGADFKRLANRLYTKLAQRVAAFNVTCFVVDEIGTVPGQPWKVRRA